MQPYIFNKRVVCNKAGAVTAKYIGVDLGDTEVGKKFTCRWIFEKNLFSGTVALVFNPNGITNVQQILNRALHIVITNTYVTLQLLDDGGYYESFAHHDFAQPLALDGITENTCIVEIVGNTVNMTVNGTTYSDTFTDETYDISDFNGRYAIFEFYTNMNRDIVAMPEFTYVKIEGSDTKVIEDDFDRGNGPLTVTPDGDPYSVY